MYSQNCVTNACGSCACPYVANPCPHVMRSRERTRERPRGVIAHMSYRVIGHRSADGRGSTRNSNFIEYYAAFYKAQQGLYRFIPRGHLSPHGADSNTPPSATALTPLGSRSPLLPLLKASDLLTNLRPHLSRTAYRHAHATCAWTSTSHQYHTMSYSIHIVVNALVLQSLCITTFDGVHLLL